MLQAAGAKQVLASDPARAEAALVQVVSVGRQSMGELRRLLGVLRDGAPADDDDGADALGPQPGLADLPALVTSFRTAGLDVRTELVGRPQPLDPSVDLSAHRIVREALTNVTKHCGPRTRVVVRQAWTPEVLLLEVTDSGPPGRVDPVVTRGAMSTGNGLVGLRERARAVGGRLDAGPVEGGGFRVAAALPVPTVAEHPAGGPAAGGRP